MNLFKKTLSKFLGGILAASMVLTQVSYVFAAQPEITWPADMPTTNRDDASDEVKAAGTEFVSAFSSGNQEAVEDALGTLQSISANEWYPIYSAINDMWNYIEDEMPENIGVAPDGIEDPAHHCFITLGFALNTDGTMTDELIGRLEVTLASLQKYPEAKVLVTGGVEKNGWTEGQRMHDWLVANGISEDRIYVENKAPDTAGNATNSFEILYEDGTINTVSLISSQYHVKRGSILYYTESLLKAKELGDTPIEFLADYNAGWYREDKTSEPMTTKANSMYSILRVPTPTQPVLSGTLTGLDIIDSTGANFLRHSGDWLNVDVKTLDTNNDNLTVTNWVTFSGYDRFQYGWQTVTATYTDKSNPDAPVTVSQDFSVCVLKPEADEPVFTMPDNMPTTSRDDMPDDIKTYLANMIYYYGSGDTDVADSFLEKIQAESPDEWYPIIADIFTYWDWIENNMNDNINVAPDGIEDPAHHCFITLGFALNTDGTMTDELIGRLEVTLASLEKYPEAKVLVTGGVEKNGWTEGQRMHDWLVDHGISEDRIFVENKAPDTAGNATNSFEILYEDGNINTVSLISSQYHLDRGSILYYTESILKAKELGETEVIRFLGNYNAGWLRTDKLTEPMTTKAGSMYTIFRVNPTAPMLTGTLTGLTVNDGTNANFYRHSGDWLNVDAITVDTDDQQLNVTNWTTFDGYDRFTLGWQTVTATYTDPYSGIVAKETFNVCVLKEDADEPVFTMPANMPTTSRDDASDEVKEAGSKLIYCFGEGDSEGVEQALADIQELSPDEWYPIYADIVDYWNWIENNMNDNIDVAPDGIEDPAHHCFITLGYALNEDGTMTDELIGRLEVTLASLEKYPEAKVLVTGGVEKNGWTEGVRMHDWLVEHGISEDRIFVENKAPDTAGNATNSFEILYEDGNIKTVSLISSQYHLDRGSILYYTESILKAKELGETDVIRFLGNYNAGWLRTDKTSEPMSTKANSMYSILRVEKRTMPVLKGELTGLDVIDSTGKNFVRDYGEELNLVVKTLDTKNDNLTVTEFCTFTGYDAYKPGKQTVTVSFTYEGLTVTKTVTVTVNAMDGTSIIYRLYNPNSGEHFFTKSAHENAVLIEAGWKDEGIGFVTQEYSDTPVYRVYNPNAGEHHYTTSKNEVNTLVRLGWRFEGIAWYSDPDESITVYRVYNPNATVGSHHYTSDLNEYNTLGKLGWRLEGTSFFAAA